MNNNEFKSVCPYKFHNMFKNKENTDGDLRDSLVYEVFSVKETDDLTASFNNFMKKLGEKEESLFKAGVEDVYKGFWSNITGNEKPRLCLYPKNSEENRLSNKSENSEIGYILELIKQSTADISYEKEYMQGYEGSNSYIYNIYENERMIFTIRPCCPVCRTLLPDMWFSDIVKAYIPISLIAGKSGGKTTYMTSLISDDFIVLLRDMGTDKWWIDYGIKYEKERLSIQTTRFSDLEKLRSGEYPASTDNPMPPVCINISKLSDEEDCIDEQVIVSIFDCKGELYENLGKNQNTEEELKFLKSMYSYIFLMDPDQMERLPHEDKPDDNKKEVKILSIEEQGKMQGQEHQPVNARDLIKNNKNSDKVDMILILRNIKSINLKNPNNLHHIAYTIVKSDELLKHSEELDTVDGMRELCSQGECINAFDDDNFVMVEEAVKDFIEAFFFNESRTKVGMSLINSIGGKKVAKSWHCVSVAKPRPNLGKNKCEYDPLRIAEPFARCIIEKFKELGWI